jgi:hypothetical protein
MEHFAFLASNRDSINGKVWGSKLYIQKVFCSTSNKYLQTPSEAGLGVDFQTTLMLYSKRVVVVQILRVRRDA